MYNRDSGRSWIKRKIGSCAFGDTKSGVQQQKKTVRIEIYAKGVPAHASTIGTCINAAGVTFECLEKQVLRMTCKIYNTHLEPVMEPELV